jgi:AcrR family transcriptional regulator
MPRGVAIPEVREQLFAAADRVLARSGPAALTTRAITKDAGVANGILHRHFRGLDAFLAEFAADRLAAIAGSAASLPGRAGTGSITDNLTDATLALFGPGALALVNLVATRPELAAAMEHAGAAAGGGLGDVERHFTAYLDAEKQLGRVGAGADTATLAFTLLGAVHHLIITNPGGLPDLPQRIRRIVTALTSGTGAGAAQPR